MTRPALAFSAVSLAYFGCVGLFNPYAPLWFQSLGLSTLAIGTIASLQAWTRIVTPYAWSWVADHGGRRVALLRLAAAGATTAAVLLAGAHSYAAVAVATVALFAFNSAIVPLSEAAVAQHVAGEHGVDAGRYGRVRVWGSVGFVVTVLGGGVLLEAAGIAAFPYAIVLLYGGLLAAAFAVPDVRDGARHDEPAPPIGRLLRRREVIWFFASIFFTVLAHTSVYAFLSLYLADLGYGKTAVGLLWAISVVLEIVFFWTQGRWFDRLSAHAWLMVAAGASALRFSVTAAAAHWVVPLALAQASHALTFAAHHGACIALLHRHFPGRLRGRGQALYSALGYGASGVLGGVGGGWLIAREGYAAVFWAGAACAAIGLACAWRAARAAGPKDDLRLGQEP